MELSKRATTNSPTGEELHCWAPAGSPSLVDQKSAAQRLARERLEVLSGERIDVTPDSATIDWVRAQSGDHTAEFVAPADFEARFESGRIPVRQIIRLSGHFLVREDEEPHEWWMGVESDHEPGVIVCWGVYGTLASAIASL